MIAASRRLSCGLIQMHVSQCLTALALQRTKVLQMGLPFEVRLKLGRHLRGVIMGIEQLVDEGGDRVSPTPACPVGCSVSPTPACPVGCSG